MWLLEASQNTSRYLPSSNDRFIPHRSAVIKGLSMSYFGNDLDTEEKAKNEDILTQDIYEYLKEEYRKQLRQMLGFPSPSCNLLGLNSSHRSRDRYTQWPVKPRRKPMIFGPEGALDLPNFRQNICCHLVDWASSGCIAASLEWKVYLYHPNKEMDIRELNLNDHSYVGIELGTAVKWDNDGIYLAVGTCNSHIMCWNTRSLKMNSDALCFCATTIEENTCSIISLVWHNETIVSGCSRGIVKVMCLPNLEKGSRLLFPFMDYVTEMKNSADATYLAILTNDCCLSMWKWPNLLSCYEIFVECSTQALAWHPWQPSLLAFGGYENHSSITVFNVQTQKVVASRSPKTRSIICALEWNQITAELVAGYWVQADPTAGQQSHYELLVLSSLTKVVDKIQFGEMIHIFQILWNPDGKILATASSDETLRLWNFIGREKNGKKKSSKMEKSFLRSRCKDTQSFSKYIIR